MQELCLRKYQEMGSGCASMVYTKGRRHASSPDQRLLWELAVMAKCRAEVTLGVIEWLFNQYYYRARASLTHSRGKHSQGHPQALCFRKRLRSTFSLQKVNWGTVHGQREAQRPEYTHPPTPSLWTQPGASLPPRPLLLQHLICVEYTQWFSTCFLPTVLY